MFVDNAESRATLRDWGVVLFACCNAFCNGNMSVGFSATIDVVMESIHLSKDQISSMYYGLLASVLIGMTPGHYLTAKREIIAIGFTGFCLVCAPWFRWWGLLWTSYPLCLLSSLITGASTWTMLTVPAQVAQQRFPLSQRPLITSLIVQANYLGWLVGCVVPPFLVHTEDDLYKFLLGQALLYLLLVPAFLMLYRPARVKSFHHEETADYLGFFKTLVQWPRLVFLIVAHGTVGGISFAGPSAIDFIMNAHGYSAVQSALVTGCFLGFGVLGGILIGMAGSEESRFGFILRFCYIFSTASLAACAALGKTGVLDPDKGWTLPLLTVLCSIAGATTLGFIGIGIQSTALFYPQGSDYVCWAMEIFMQAGGAFFSAYASRPGGFFTLSCSTFACLIMFFGAYRTPKV